MKLKNGFKSVVLLIVILVLSSCPEPLDYGKLSVLQDLNAPKIIITSPADYSEYATVIELSGYIEDASLAEAAENAGLAVLYSIPGTSVSGSADIHIPDGVFAAMIDVSSLNGDKILELKTADLNGNESSVSINIIKPAGGGDISGFSVNPASKQVFISWDPVPGADSYSICELAYVQTIQPEQITGTSYTWTGLENGDIYSFQLTAHLPDTLGADAVSGIVSRLPLSTRTFAPEIKETGYRSVTITWQNNDGIERFVVEQSPGPDGPWERKRVLTANEYTDNELDFALNYYYRINPINYPEIKSDYIIGTPAKSGYTAVGSIATPNAYTGDIIITGNNAYVIDDNYGSADLLKFDVSDPGNPVLLKSLDYSIRMEDLCLSGDYAFIAGGDSGLQIIDLVQFSEPVTFASGGYARGVAVADDYAYLAAEDAGLQIVDIFNPLIPESAGSYTGDGDLLTVNAREIAVDGGYAYIVNDSDTESLLIVNIENQAEPVFAGSLDFSGSIHDVIIEGNSAFVFEEYYGIHIIDISDKALPTLTSSFETPSGAYTGIIEGSIAFIAGKEAGLLALDITDLSEPRIIGRCDTPDAARAVAVSDQYAYVGDHKAGLQIIHMFHPNSPSLAFTYPIDGGGSGVTASGDYIFVVDWNSGLRILDVSNPYSPVLKSVIATSGTAESVTVAGKYAYIGDRGSGLQIVDVTDAAEPVLAGSCNTLNAAYDAAVSGDYAYVAVSAAGLQIIDISNPLAPESVSICNTLDYTLGVSVSGDYAYAAVGNAGLEIIDVSDPAAPVSISSIAPGFGFDVAVVGNYAYIAAGGSGLQIVDITNPFEPTVTGSCATLNIAYAISVAGNYAYISDYAEGLQIIDISDPEAPVLIGGIDTPDYAKSVAVSGAYAFVTDTESGLQIISLLGE